MLNFKSWGHELSFWVVLSIVKSHRNRLQRFRVIKHLLQLILNIVIDPVYLSLDSYLGVAWWEENDSTLHVGVGLFWTFFKQTAIFKKKSVCHEYPHQYVNTFSKCFNEKIMKNILITNLKLILKLVQEQYKQYVWFSSSRRRGHCHKKFQPVVFLWSGDGEGGEMISWQT